MISTIVRSALLVAFASAAAIASASSTTQGAPKLEVPAASPNAKVEQRIGLTDFSITYARPSVKGRKIFGELVPYGQVWRTGANTATALSFSTAVKFGGADVPAGTYALFTIPEAGEWTVILSKVTGQWGAYAYDAKDDAVRVKVKPTKLAEAVETLEIGFGSLRDESATLDIRWETTRVSVPLAVDVVGVVRPQIEAAMKGEGKKPYFQAAMFYFEHDLDLKQALTWMDAGLAEQPDAFWMLYRKGLILEKSGDKKGAVAAAEASLALAEKAKGGIKDEYVALNKALIARCK